jgi:hypothetical protein
MMSTNKKQECIHDAHEFGTFDNVTGVCWVCRKTAGQATGGGNAPRFEVKSLPKPDGSKFGIYKDGELYEGGYFSEEAAKLCAAELAKLPAVVWEK